jgi:hypothetical protein
MYERASEISRRLAQNAEAVCRHYLPAGRRNGNYWLVGDPHNTPGRSLYVKLKGPDSGPGAAGKWTDAATDQHGDLLDLIRINRRYREVTEAMDEARSFLALPPPAPIEKRRENRPASERPPDRSIRAARRLFRIGQPLAGTHAAAYLAARGLAPDPSFTALRFHPAVWHWADGAATRQSFPALLAAVTDAKGAIMGVHRTWLDPAKPAKAPLEEPRKALGWLLGHGVRFGAAHDLLAAGEGIETVLSVVAALPGLPAVAALSANHLVALEPPPTLSRFYVAVDNDAEGLGALDRLRARHPDLDIRPLMPAADDFNTDLMARGLEALRAALVPQLADGDADRLLEATPTR